MEFEHEAENEAETNVKEMEFLDPIDPDEDIKVAVLDIYNDKLAIRKQRKDVIIERGLLDFKKVQNQERKRSKEEKDMMTRFRAFARMLTKEDYDFAEKNFTSAWFLPRSWFVEELG
jgi:transcriptional adapter 2-alpha